MKNINLFLDSNDYKTNYTFTEALEMIKAIDEGYDCYNELYQILVNNTEIINDLGSALLKKSNEFNNLSILEHYALNERKTSRILRIIKVFFMNENFLLTDFKEGILQQTKFIKQRKILHSFYFLKWSICTLY